MRHFLAITAITLAACAETSETAETAYGPPRNVTDYNLANTPLSKEARTELLALQGKLASPDGQRACSAEEREFAVTSLILYAIDIENDHPASWSAAQKSRVDALRRRWEALGGDARDLSRSCRNAMSLS